MICFYCAKVYVAVLDTQTGELVWFYQFEGNVEDYWLKEPAFHPTRRILVWLEQYGNDGENFNSKEDCGMWLVACGDDECRQ